MSEMLLRRAARVESTDEKTTLKVDFEDVALGMEPETSSSSSFTSLATEITSQKGQELASDDVKGHRLEGPN